MIRRFTITLACLAGFLVLPAAAGADEIAWMYDPDQVVEIRLGGLSEAELDELEVEPSEEVRGTFELRVDGVPKGPLLEDVGIRRKGGFGSSRPIKTGKSGLKVRFDKFVKGQVFYGIKRLTLNNMFQDRSMVHETLTYELFHGLDLPASRTGYAFVTLNGESYGLFLNLETLDEISLPQWFPTTQHLFEADAPGTDVRPGEAETFEVDEGDDGVGDLGDLEALIAAANDEEGDWSEGMAGVADLEAMAAQWAVERYVGHWDGYAGSAEESPDPEDPIRPNNYYLHSDEAGIFQFLPWGTDQAWEYFNFQFDEEAGGLMFNKCLADASCKDLYLDSLTDVHCLTSELGQAAHAAELASMLAPFQAMEDPVRRGYTAEDIAEAVENAEEFPEQRAERLVDYLTAEGRLGGGLDPCATPPEPDDPQQAQDAPPIVGPPPPPPIVSARIGRSKVKGDLVVTRVHVTGAAKVTKRVFALSGGERRRVCVDRAQRAAAGRLVVSCRLSPWALQRLDEGPVKLEVHVGFVPSVGAFRLAKRTLTLPRR